MMGFIEKKKQEIISKATTIASDTLKNSVITLLGDNARPEDVKLITSYFEDGHAAHDVRKALEKAKII